MRIVEFIDWVLGDKESMSSERYFMSVVCVTSSFFLIILCVFHIIENLKVLPVFIAGGSAAILFFLYTLVRFGRCLFIPKLLVTLLGLIALDFTWHAKFMSAGPVLFFILVFGALILWVWDGKALAVMLILYFLNLVILFVIEYFSPVDMLYYPTGHIRSFDVYFSFITYSSLMILMLFTVKKDFQRQKSKVERSEKVKSAFLANMSHEIRTPMNAIIGFSELLEIESDNEKRLQYTSIIRSSGSLLLKLLNDIIDLSRIEAGDIKLVYSHFNIRDLFIELDNIYALELIRKGKSKVSFNFDMPDGEFFIYSDSGRIRQVLTNLLSNAVTFTTSGSIHLSLSKTKTLLVFSVSDTGTGIPIEDQKKVFDRFITFNYNNLNSQGTGIGLSISEKIIEALGGKIWLISKVGDGSTFYFQLPILKGND